MKKLRVDLGINSYDILIKKGLINNIGDYIPNQIKKVFVITDNNVNKLYSEVVKKSLVSNGFDVDILVLPAGEKTKSFDTLPIIYKRMIEFGLTRKDLVITLGGGVIGDLGGFASATYQRGISFMQVPTTLLAQVDSSVGGKVAVDLAQGKNLVGCFYQPTMVLIDPNLLNTLSQELFADGMAEVIKYGCIKDKELFDQLNSYDKSTDIMADIEEIIYKCCDIKRIIVQSDEKDFGERMILNFGHTYGHALEKYYNYEHLSHGQAVAIGMVYITQISQKLNFTKDNTADEIQQLLKKFHLPTQDPTNPALVIGGVSNDKKNLGNKLNVVLLKEIGKGYIYNTDKEFFERYGLQDIQ